MFIWQPRCVNKLDKTGLGIKGLLTDKRLHTPAVKALGFISSERPVSGSGLSTDRCWENSHGEWLVVFVKFLRDCSNFGWSLSTVRWEFSVLIIEISLDEQRSTPATKPGEFALWWPSRKSKTSNELVCERTSRLKIDVRLWSVTTKIIMWIIYTQKELRLVLNFNWFY